ASCNFAQCRYRQFWEDRHWRARRELPSVLQHFTNVAPIERRDPCLAVGDAIGDQEPFAVRMPGETSGKLDALLMQEERSAHRPYPFRLVEGEEPVLKEGTGVR